ncbi:rab11 family-interacting protein 4A isoform X6 [Hermetia illucens]|uniref:rab11 family-interacting protein 4A isoform X6 n=1 Tax=Hermetia illucens TaxID=343691 RepID=UPI0018CC5ADC|nr:rab11 family-interacting protein 4A isoform X6 [Hermetia illucens]
MSTSVSISEPPSQPESLDLDYDMWQGQFEFVGNNVNNNLKSSQKLTDSLEDLNFNIKQPQDILFNNNKPILIDEETFLSLHPTDFCDSGPNSTLFFDNINNIDNAKVLNKDTLLNNKYNNTKQIQNSNNNSSTFKLENLKNYKNKLISDLASSGDKNCFNLQNIQQQQQQSQQKMNGFTAEICDNLNEQLDLLQRQVTDLADTRNTVEDRTTRTKTEYAVLQARYHMLEEQFRESELRAEERLAEEQKRHRELLARVEREAALQNENCQIKIRTIEMEANSLREEAQRLRVLCDKQANDLHATEEKLEITRDNLASVQQELLEAQSAERKLLDEKKVSEDLMLELGKELERLRSERGPALPTTSAETLRLEELHQELDELRQKNKILEEQNEELQAAVLSRGVEEGRHLLNGTLNSLAQELEEMSQAQLQQAYQDKEEENQRLKHYIDTILLNIVENYPQLLEVKPSKPVQNEKISH